MYFEDHRYCGPLVCNAAGDPIKQPGPRHPFWKAVTRWYEQGKKIVDGVCAWETPPEPRIEHIGGKHYRVINTDPTRDGSGREGDTSSRAVLEDASETEPRTLDSNATLRNA